MNPCKVIPEEMQTQRVPQVAKLLTESIGKTGESTHLHPHGQILRFYERVGELFPIGDFHDECFRESDTGVWGVAHLCVIARILLFYHKLR